MTPAGAARALETVPVRVMAEAVVRREAAHPRGRRPSPSHHHSRLRPLHTRSMPASASGDGCFAVKCHRPLFDSSKHLVSRASGKPMQKESCAIAVFGLFGSSNLGNEATLAAFLQNLRQAWPGVRILTIVPRASAIDQTNGLVRLQMDPLPVQQLFWRLKPGRLQRIAVNVAALITEPLRRRRAAKLLEGVQTLFVPGTGVVDDFGQGPLDMPLHLDRWTAAAAAVGARVVFCSIGAATLQSALSRYFFLRSLRRSAYCSFRDQISNENARALGYAGDPIVPDLVFGLKRAQHHSTDARWPPRTIGVGLMGYSGWNLDRDDGERVYRAYIARIQTLIVRLLERGYAVRLLIGDTSADARTSRDLLAALAPASDPHFIAAPIATYQALIDEIALCDMVVATRYHNVLLSLLAGRPTISLGYSDKNDALMQSMHQAAYVHAIEVFDVDDVIAQISALASLRESPRAALLARAQQMRNRVIQQFETLFAAEVTEYERCSRSAH